MNGVFRWLLDVLYEASSWLLIAVLIAVALVVPPFLLLLAVNVFAYYLAEASVPINLSTGLAAWGLLLCFSPSIRSTIYNR